MMQSSVTYLIYLNEAARGLSKNQLDSNDPVDRRRTLIAPGQLHQRERNWSIIDVPATTNIVVLGGV
jgi:hypothetical protein